jgi:hypothetical protein
MQPWSGRVRLRAAPLLAPSTGSQDERGWHRPAYRPRCTFALISAWANQARWERTTGKRDRDNSIAVETGVSSLDGDGSDVFHIRHTFLQEDTPVPLVEFTVGCSFQIFCA